MKNPDESPCWWLYLIATRSNVLYCGITTDVERRFREHSSDTKKGARSLRGKGPLKLVFSIRAGSRSQALKAEYAVKQLTRVEKLSMIAGDRSVLLSVGLSAGTVA